jgi:hypothetical protein
VIALLMSDGFKPVTFACLRARRISPSKSFMEGADKVLKMMAATECQNDITPGV